MKTFIFTGLLAGFACSCAAQVIPPNAKIYVAMAGTAQYEDGADGGFDFYLTAALQAKHVPVTVVTDRSMADYELEAVSEHVNQLHNRSVEDWIVRDWTGPAMPQSIHANDEASIRLVNIATREVVFAYSVDRNNPLHGRQTAAESCAKHLKVAMLGPTQAASSGNPLKIVAKRLQILPSKDPALDF